MKTTFRRVFFPTAAILLLASLTVGIAFQLLARNSMKGWAMDNLRNEAQALADISAAYYGDDKLTSQEFYMNLEVCTKASGADAVICDASGRLVLCSDSPLGCDHTSLSVDPAFFQRVVKEGCTETTGRIRGIYEDRRYMVSVPIVDAGGQVRGIVIVSAPTVHTQQMIRNMTKIYLVLLALGMLAAVLTVAYSARRVSRPLREMAGVAGEFAHSRFDCRVDVDQRSPQEVQELACSFNNMANSLQKSEQQRQEFVSNVSHELKTPMTTISGYVDGMLDGTIPAEKQEIYMRLVSDETKRLSRLVRSMLDISRLQSQGVMPEEQKRRFDVCECAGRVLVSFEQAIVAKQLRVEADLPEYPVYTLAAEDAIVQVIYNLVDNAVKFCPENGLLRLSVEVGEKKLQVCVENDGPTIPAQELPLLFERFHKTDKSRSRQQEGWGLGLYIVKKILDTHGEDISVTSENGRTSFTFTLPVVNGHGRNEQ